MEAYDARGVGQNEGNRRFFRQAGRTRSCGRRCGRNVRAGLTDLLPDAQADGAHDSWVPPGQLSAIRPALPLGRPHLPQERVRPACRKNRRFPSFVPPLEHPKPPCGLFVDP